MKLFLTNSSTTDCCVSRSFILIQNYFAFSLLFRLIDLFYSYHFLCLGEAIYCNLRCNIGAVHYTYVFIVHERYHYHCLILIAVIAKQLPLLELLLFLLSLYSKILIIRTFDQPNARLHETYKERSNNQMLDEIDLDNNQVLLHIVDIYMHVYIMYIIYI